MEGDTDDDDNIFDLGDDDEDELQEDVADGELSNMGNDPYDANDWDVLVIPEGQEEPGELVETDELLYDGCEEDDYVGDDDEDLNDLMDKGLEEVNDILRKKGRLSVAPARALADTELSSANERSDALPNADSLQYSSTQEANAQGARGTGAQAASTLRALAGPLRAGSAGDLHHTERLTQQVVLQPREVTETLNNSNNTETANDTVPFAAADGTVGLSPTRRRPKREPPFIQAKGVTLTYAQAKLFGLVGTTFSPDPPSPSPTGDRPVSLSEVLQASKTNTRPSPKDTRRGDGFGGYVKGERRPRNGTYSPTRMEHLARPVPGRGGVSTNDTGVARKRAGLNGIRESGGEGSFTWRRSRRAEAAMRDPACGYDFVRDSGGFSDQKGFLARVEAYSSYSRAKLETRRAEKLYAACQDKLECPRCTNPQSYDEFSSKKLMCPGCDVAYCRPKTWNRSVWERRNEMCAAKSGERQARTEKEAEEEFIRRMPRQTRHAALLRQRVGQVAFIARMRQDLRKRRARQTSMRHGIHKDEVPTTDNSHRRHRSTAPTATTAKAACLTSSPPGATKTPTTRHRAAMELIYVAVAEGERSYYDARGTTRKEAPASTVVSKEPRSPKPGTTNSPLSRIKPHQSVIQNAHDHDASPNLLATPIGPCVAVRDGGDIHSTCGDGPGRGKQVPRPSTAPKLTTLGGRNPSFPQSR